MGIPIVLPGLPAPDTNMDSRVILGGLDLSQPVVTAYGVVYVTGQKVDGWSTGTSSTRDVVQRAYRPGAVASRYPQSRPRIVTLSLVLTAESPAAMREMTDLLNVAASKDDTPMIRDRWGRRERMTVFRQGDVAERLFNSALVKGWSCQLKAADPRKYGEQVQQTTGLPSVIGGLVAPLTAPLLSTAVTNTGVITIVNAGNEIAPVRLRIDGPAVAPKITHAGTGRELTFASSYSLPAGSWLDIDLERHEVVEAGQVSRAQFVTSRGWFDATPGRNDFLFSADTYNDAARLTVVTASAWE